MKRGRIVAVADVREDARTRDFAEAWRALGIRALINVPVIERGEVVAIGFAHWPDPHAVTAEEQAFVRAVADRTQAGVARLRAEERQAVVNGEINHRLKNTLAMVQAIAAQTLKGAQDREAVVALQSRLQALATAHDALLQTEWERAELGDIIARAARTAGVEDRVDVQGAAVSLGSRAALSTSLLIHELATNAVKYGSLSVATGRVHVAWRIDQDGRLTLTWAEHGGPPAREPTHRGFGSRLLRGGLIGTGGASLSYETAGFSGTFEAETKQLEAA